MPFKNQHFLFQGPFRRFSLECLIASLLCVRTLFLAAHITDDFHLGWAWMFMKPFNFFWNKVEILHWLSRICSSTLPALPSSAVSGEACVHSVRGQVEGRGDMDGYAVGPKPWFEFISVRAWCGELKTVNLTCTEGFPFSSQVYSEGSGSGLPFSEAVSFQCLKNCHLTFVPLHLI